jgi:hypothetical protein
MRMVAVARSIRRVRPIARTGPGAETEVVVMSIPFAIHRPGSVVPVGRIPGLHSGCALGLVPASGDLLRFARGLSVFGTDVRRLGVPEGVEGAHGNGRIKCVRRLQTDRSCWQLGYAQGRPLHFDRQWYRRGLQNRMFGTRLQNRLQRWRAAPVSASWWVAQNARPV